MPKRCYIIVYNAYLSDVRILNIFFYLLIESV